VGNVTFQRKHILGLGIAALVFILDQLIKWLMTGPLQLQAIRQIVILPFFNLTWTENYGVSLGLLTADSNAMRWGLVALTGAIAVFVAVWLLREKKLGDITALALVLGGALGNIVDRGTAGYVIDYADLHFGEWRPFLIFNLADAAITIGVLIILARSFLSREKPEPEQAQIDPAQIDPANSASES
jgi:signal peptidase II